MMHIKKTIKSIFMNLPGWRTNRKILVFESDDWGSIRMASKEAYEGLLKEGYRVDECDYNRYDMLENNDDVEALFELLLRHKDKNGNPAKFTLNNIVGNPDFEKIKQSDFQQYYYEPFTKTYEKYPNHHHVVNSLKEGMTQGTFSVQFHGREHVNVDNWMKHLQANDPVARTAFNHQMFSVHKEGTTTVPRKEFLDTYGLSHNNTKQDYTDSISEGLKLFEKMWNHKSSTMIAPTCVWDDTVEIAAQKQGVKWMQGVYVQLIPTTTAKSGVKIRRLYLGRKSKTGLRNLVRNVYFEPSSHTKHDWLGESLKSIDLAFKMNKPAIVATHRVNYLGGLVEENRKKNLRQLKELLTSVIKKYPDVEFMSSDELGNLMGQSL